MASLGGPLSCPPGFYWDELTSQCVPIEGVGLGPPIIPPIVVVPPPPPPAPVYTPPPRRTPPPGTIAAPPFAQATGPTLTQTTQPGVSLPFLGSVFTGGSGTTTFEGTSSASTSTEGLGGVTNVFVNADQAVNLADNSAANAVSSVASAVSSAIQTGALYAGSVANDVTQQVNGTLSNLVGAINSGITGAYGQLQGVVSGIENGVSGALGDIGTSIGSQIFNAVNPVSTGLQTIANSIAFTIGGLAGQIVSGVANIIPVIVGAVTGSLSPIQATLAGIQDVLQTQLGGLVTSSGEIATSLGGLQVTLDTVLSHYESFLEKQTGYPDDGTLHSDLSAIWKAIAGIAQVVVGNVAPKPSDQIESVCGEAEITQMLNKPWIPPDEGSNFWDLTLKIFIKGLVSALFYLASVFPAIRKSTEALGQRFDQACPFEPLSPAALVDAVRRGILPYADAVIEAAKGDLSESRFKILSDLGTHQLSPGQLVEAKYRGIVTDADYQQALQAQGWTQSQVNALTDLAVNLVPVELLWRMRQRQIIDDATLKAALAARQFDQAQQEALSELSFRPPNFNEAIDGERSLNALIQMGLASAADPAQIPEFVSEAAQNEGLDRDTTQARWVSHWNTGPLASWITLWFRGLISTETLQAAAGRQYIPADLVSTLVESQRPLVQYRTIANMLRIGQIDVQTAGKLLLQHGYSQENAQLLITYAQRPGAAAAAQKAKALHAVSLSIAKREYIDGAITENDYYQILLQHGYTIEGANAEIAVENANQAMLVRKQNAQLVVDEYGAGLITEQTALAQLAALGLTIQELAKYAHKIRIFRVKGAKQLTEVQLNDFRKNGIIDTPTYTRELELVGYSNEAAGWFTAYRTLPSAPATASAVPPAATSGGTTNGSTPVTPTG